MPHFRLHCDELRGLHGEICFGVKNRLVRLDKIVKSGKATEEQERAHKMIVCILETFIRDAWKDVNERKKKILRPLKDEPREYTRHGSPFCFKNNTLSVRHTIETYEAIDTLAEILFKETRAKKITMGMFISSKDYWCKEALNKFNNCLLISKSVLDEK